MMKTKTMIPRRMTSTRKKTMYVLGGWLGIKPFALLNF